MAGQLEPEYTPQRKERFVRIIHCVIIAVQVLLLVCSSHYQPLMVIYHQEYQSLEGILMGALLAGMAYTDARNKNDSYKYTKGVSMGPGFGDWGELTCSRHSRCLSEIFDLMDKEYDWLSGEFK